MATEKLRSLIAETPTAALVTSLLAIEAGERTPEGMLVRGMTLGELEQRFPQAAEAVETAYDAADEDDEVDYVAVLLAALPAGAYA
jgi:hypothetical protein